LSSLAGAEGFEPSARGFGVLEFAFGDLWQSAVTVGISSFFDFHFCNFL
jgi:hypothetical protein